MKTVTPRIIVHLLGLMVLISLFAFTISSADDEKKPWKVPAKYEKMENPYKTDKSLIKVGKSLYSKHCASCHGKKGLGDGSKAKSLDTYPGDFSEDEFQDQSDGALFYKTYIGRDEMPNYEKKITDDEDQWAVINFLRTL